MLEIHPERSVELTSLDKGERGRLREIIGAVLLAILVFGSLIYAGKSWAEDVPLHVLEKEGVEIRLMDLPCTDSSSIVMIRVEHLARFKAIHSVWPERDGSRKAYAGCWAELSKDEVHAEEGGFLLVFSDGQSGFVPKSEFKKVKGQRGA
jgi:hypothetical protein